MFIGPWPPLQMQWQRHDKYSMHGFHSVLFSFCCLIDFAHGTERMMLLVMMRHLMPGCLSSVGFGVWMLRLSGCVLLTCAFYLMICNNCIIQTPRIQTRMQVDTESVDRHIDRSTLQTVSFVFIQLRITIQRATAAARLYRTFAIEFARLFKWLRFVPRTLPGLLSSCVAPKRAIVLAFVDA